MSSKQKECSLRERVVWVSGVLEKEQRQTRGQWGESKLGNLGQTYFLNVP